MRGSSLACIALRTYKGTNVYGLGYVGGLNPPKKTNNGKSNGKEDGKLHRNWFSIWGDEGSGGDSCLKDLEFRYVDKASVPAKTRCLASSLAVA